MEIVIIAILDFKELEIRIILRNVGVKVQIKSKRVVVEFLFAYKNILIIVLCMNLLLSVKNVVLDLFFLLINLYVRKYKKNHNKVLILFLKPVLEAYLLFA